MKRWFILGLLLLSVAVACGAIDVPIAPAQPVKTIYVSVIAQNYPHGPASTIVPTVTVTNSATAVLAWDPSPTPGAIYTLLWGREQLALTNSTFVGTNTVGRLVTVKSNVVLAVRGYVGASVNGPWKQPVEWPTLYFTNPPATFTKTEMTATNY